MFIIDTLHKNNYNSTCIAHVCIDEKARNEALYIFLACFPVNRLWSEIIYLRYKFLGVRDLTEHQSMITVG